MLVVEAINAGVHFQASHSMFQAIIVVCTLWHISVACRSLELHGLSQGYFTELVPLVGANHLVKIKSETVTRVTLKLVQFSRMGGLDGAALGRSGLVLFISLVSSF